MDSDPTIPWRTVLHAARSILGDRAAELMRVTEPAAGHAPNPGLRFVNGVAHAGCLVARSKTAGRRRVADKLRAEQAAISRLAGRKQLPPGGLDAAIAGLLLAWVTGHDESLTALIDSFDGVGLDDLHEYLGNVGSYNYGGVAERMLNGK